MSREVQVRFCESRGVRLPPATHLIVHCDSEDQARGLWAAIAARLGALGLELHPGKTKIVYCKDANRRGDFGHTSFDFLGHADLRVMPTSDGNSLSAAANGPMRSA